MAYKHQTESYRDGGKWICWCDGLDAAARITKYLRTQGIGAKREKDRVFILAADRDKVTRQMADHIAQM